MIQILLRFVLLLSAPKTEADWILHSGTIYTVDSSFTITQAMVIQDGKIVETGSNETILNKYTATKITNLEGKSVLPGFIDAHCHFLNYGIGKSYASLENTKSFNEVLETVKKHDASKTGGWIIGRGWDQNDWDVKEFPDCKQLDVLFPETPVYLVRIDGHAALVNSKALELAGIHAQTKISGGVVYAEGEKCTGLLLDNAMLPVEKLLPIQNPDFQKNALLLAQKDCFSVGLTGVHDAGVDAWQVELMHEQQKLELLKMRIYAMLSWNDENFKYAAQKGKIKSDYLNVRAFKCYADGALGSRGAALLAPYSDEKNNSGLLFWTFDSLQNAADKIASLNFQMCTHAIGDAANRQVLDVYGSVLTGKNNNRWRIEHCQVIDAADFIKFQTYSIIPSVQPTHATSDMYWADERLGETRIKTAYAYKHLLQQNNMLAAGSDFPVENINPLLGFYAAVSRKDIHDYPAGGFQSENALTREEALKSMTIWAAYVAFEENEKGSLEPGKFADFVILDTNIMTEQIQLIPKAKVLTTAVGGEIVFQQ